MLVYTYKITQCYNPEDHNLISYYLLDYIKNVLKMHYSYMFLVEHTYIYIYLHVIIAY
jgi:hypothetical protein